MNLFDSCAATRKRWDICYNDVNGAPSYQSRVPGSKTATRSNAACWLKRLCRLEFPRRITNVDHSANVLCRSWSSLRIPFWECSWKIIKLSSLHKSSRFSHLYSSEPALKPVNMDRELRCSVQHVTFSSLLGLLITLVPLRCILF